MHMAVDDRSRKAHFAIEWREGFKIKIDQIDEEHRHLFTLVKALDLPTVDATIEELLNYVVKHFTNEQTLMEDSGYPAFEQHLKLHEEFGVHVADFLGTSDDWTEERVQELRRFLNKWLIGHIMTHDLRFGQWYGKHPARTPQPVEVPVQPVQPEQPAPKRKGFFARLFGG
jgi:hemerythrin